MSGQLTIADYRHIAVERLRRQAAQLVMLRDRTRDPREQVRLSLQVRRLEDEAHLLDPR